MVSASRLMFIRGDDDIVSSRQVAREMAKSLGFGMVDQSRIATAVSELARNVVRYATGGCGEVAIKMVEEPRGTGIEIIVSDNGPGIDNLEQAMNAGFSSGRGLGMGLSGTKRLMDEMEIDSVVGRGTIVTIRKWLR